MANETKENIIELPEEIIKSAGIPLEKMLEAGR
jgi:quinolinate synthase